MLDSLVSGFALFVIVFALRYSLWIRCVSGYALVVVLLTTEFVLCVCGALFMVVSGFVVGLFAGVSLFRFPFHCRLFLDRVAVYVPWRNQSS